MVVLETNGCWSQPDLLCRAEGSGDKDLRHYNILDHRRVMLTDPDLPETQLLAAHDKFQVLVVALCRRLGRIVHGHDEHAELDERIRTKHGPTSQTIWASQTGIRSHPTHDIARIDSLSSFNP